MLMVSVATGSEKNLILLGCVFYFLFLQALGWMFLWELLPVAAVFDVVRLQAGVPNHKLMSFFKNN